jgi:hypothetical protein
MSEDGNEKPHSAADSTIDELTAEFDALLERMQALGAEEAMLRALRSSPEELGRAAVEAAKREKQAHPR